MKDKILQLLVVLSAAALLVASYLAPGGMSFDRGFSANSKGFTSYIGLADYSFSIWNLIFLGLLAFALHQGLPSNVSNPRLKAVRPWIAISLLLNCALVLALQYETILLVVMLMIVMLGTLGMASNALVKADTAPEIVLVKAPIGLYFGWITLATFVGISAATVHLGLRAEGMSASITGAIMIVILSVMGTWLRFRLNSLLYPVAIAWGVTGIAIGQSGNALIVTACALGVIALLFAAFWGFVKDK